MVYAVPTDTTTIVEVDNVCVELSGAGYPLLKTKKNKIVISRENEDDSKTHLLHPIF
jgi:hypothetical protein